MDGFHSTLDLMSYFDIDFRDLKYAAIGEMVEKVGVYPVDHYIEGLTNFVEVDSAMRHLE